MKASDTDVSDEQATVGDGLRIALISVHGLIRGHDLELGHDVDTGGQTTYVVELARALGAMRGVARVDLITRRIDDAGVANDYAKPLERLSDRANLVRVPAGGDEYIRKELLWPHLDEFAAAVQRFYRSQGFTPDVVHGHYADAGYVGARLAEAWDKPLVFTGHSLGRNKRRVLRADGMSDEEIEQDSDWEWEDDEAGA